MSSKVRTEKYSFKEISKRAIIKTIQINTYCDEENKKLTHLHGEMKPEKKRIVDRCKKVVYPLNALKEITLKTVDDFNKKSIIK